jgi:hypothetical protein
MGSVESAQKWYELGKRAAKEMHLSPQKVPHIDARGFLCHELYYLFGGSFGFIETPRKQIVLRFLERHFPIAPICRWHPPEDSTLERLGIAPDFTANGAEVYRLTPAKHPITVFFVEPKPEPHPAGPGGIFGWKIHSRAGTLIGGGSLVAYHSARMQAMSQLS